MATAPSPGGASLTAAGERTPASSTPTATRTCSRRPSSPIPRAAGTRPRGRTWSSSGVTPVLPSLRPWPTSARARGSPWPWSTSRTSTTSSPPGRRTPSPSARFLSNAVPSWSTAPRYVLLAGAATYDPRGWLGRPELDQVPTVLVRTRYLEAASDDALVELDRVACTELAIGRLPVSTLPRRWTRWSRDPRPEAPGPDDTLLLVHDRDGDHPLLRRDRRGPLGALRLEAPRTLRGADDGATHAALLEALRSGPVAVDYQGHGAEDFWAGRILADHGRRRPRRRREQPRSWSPQPASTRTSSTSAARLSGRRSSVRRTAAHGACGRHRL